MKTLLLMLASFLLAIASCRAQACEYRYTRQPPLTLDCNPYGNANRLALTCSVEGPINPEFSVLWFRKRTNSNEKEQISSFQSGVDFSTSTSALANGAAQFRRVSSRITLTGLNMVNDVGDYWCQVRLENGSLFQERSNVLALGSENQYVGLSRCGSVVLVEEMKCLQTLQDLATGVTDSSVPTINTGSVVQPTAPSPELSETTGDPVGEPERTRNNLAALYAVIAVIVVFCVVIVTLTIIIVVLYRKKCGPVRFKTEDHKQTPNPYSGFTSRERANSNHSNIVSKGERSDSRLTNSGNHQQQNVSSPASFIGFSEEEPYSRLMRDQLQHQHVGVVEVLPGYSKLEIQESVPPLPPKPPSTKSKSKTPPPQILPHASPPAYAERQSQIYSDLTERDLERGLMKNHGVPHVNIYNTLESNKETPLSPDGHEYQELSPEGEKYDYGEEFNEWRISNVTQESKESTQKSLFDDPEYSPLKGVCKKNNDNSVTVVDPRYTGDYERCPTYTCPTVQKKAKANEVVPQYRGGYEWDPTHVPKRSPRRASCSSAGTRRIPKPDEVMKRRKSLEADALHKYTGDYEWSPNYVPVPLRNGSSGPLAALDQKYSGNYERDPVYMAHVLKRSSQEKQRARSVEYTIPGVVSRENSLPPHVPHEYTQLEDNTRDPPQQYARLNSQTPELYT